MRAAFYALTEPHGDGTEALHGFTLAERGADDHGEVKVSKRRKKHKHGRDVDQRAVQ